MIASKCLSMVAEESLTNEFQMSFMERWTFVLGSNLADISVVTQKNNVRT
jgi:hypothetical protein